MQEITNNIIRFMFAGNSIFTVVSNGNHFSYKIYKKKTNDGSKIYHLYIRKANKGTYCGYFKIVNNKLTFRHSDKYGIEGNNEFLTTLQTVIRNRNNLPSDIKVYHCGRCGCCGRILTDPEAIARGFGRECWKKVRIFTD